MDWFEVASFVALFLLMASIGTELSLEDFRRVARFPLLVVVASGTQFLLLAPLAGVLSRVLDLRGEVLVGMLILGACPAGGFSNLYTYAGRGHLALSVTLTAVTCSAAVFVMPSILEVSFAYFSDHPEIVPVPAAQMFAELSARVLAPIVIGMGLRKYFPEWVSRNAQRIGRGTLLLMVAIIPAVVIDQGSSVLRDAVDGVLPAFLFTLIAMALGFLLGRLLGDNEADPFTIMIEFGARNVAIAVIICWSVLQRVELLAYCFAYMVVQIPLSLIAVAVRRNRLARLDGSGS